MARLKSWGYHGELARGNVIHLTGHVVATLLGIDTTEGVARDIFFERRPCRTLDDMDDEEKAALCRQYGCQIVGQS